MAYTINVHAQFSGVAAEIIEELIRQGYASNRTEAIRYALLECRALHKQNTLSDREVWQAITEKSAKKIWDNPKDDEVWNRY